MKRHSNVLWMSNLVSVPFTGSHKNRKIMARSRDYSITIVLKCRVREGWNYMGRSFFSNS